MTKTLFREVGRNLRDARKKAGLRQKEVVAVSGVAYRHYQNIEAGRVNVTLETLCRLAEAFGTSVSELTRERK